MIASRRVAFGLLALVAAAAAAAAARGQERGAGVPRDRASWTRGAMHYGKWLTAGAAVGLTVLGAKEHHRSAREWDTVLGICRANNADCVTGSDGRYVSPTAEYHYQLALYYDRRANRRLVGGQLSLLATAAMFIVDRRHGTNGPDNIPFDPDKLAIEPNRWGGANVGLRLRF